MKKPRLHTQGSMKYSGSSTWARTRDLRINSPALYQLSYRGTSLRLYTRKWAFSGSCHPGGGSGRNHSQVSTSAMFALATMGIQNF